MALIYVIRGVGQCHIIGLSSDTKPNYAESNGQSFFETDTGRSFLCNGAAWNDTTATSAAAWGGITGTLSNQSDLQTALNGKQVAGTYATGTGTASGTNTGDNATNSQYSGLAGSKQDNLVSGTNIKTINNSSVLGSGNLTVSGTTSIAQTEIDFGATPVSEAAFTITDANVSAGSKLTGDVAYVAPTGRDLDEVEMEPFNLRFAPGAGQFTVFIQAMEGPVVDKYKINYIIGA